MRREARDLTVELGVGGLPHLALTWMAYQSDQTGAFEVYVRPFPNVNSDQEVVSMDGGWWPLWGPSAQELFYVGPQGLMSVSVEIGSKLALGRPEPVLSMDAYVSGRAIEPRIYDISPIDRRFLMAKLESMAGRGTAELRVVLHWTQELLERAPVD